MVYFTGAPLSQGKNICKGPIWMNSKTTLMINEFLIFHSVFLYCFSKNQPGGAAEETGGAGVGWAAAETLGGLSDAEAEGRRAEGWWLWEDQRAGRRQRRCRLQGLPQAVWADHGKKGTCLASVDPPQKDTEIFITPFCIQSPICLILQSLINILNWGLHRQQLITVLLSDTHMGWNHEHMTTLLKYSP